MNPAFSTPGRPLLVPRVLSRTDALTLGFTAHAIEHRLATGQWHLVLPHTYLTCDVLTWVDKQARRPLLRGAPHAAGDHARAAAVRRRHRAAARARDLAA